MKPKSTVLLMMISSLTACATIFSGTTQKINFQAISSADNRPIAGIACTVIDGDGTTYPVTTNPGEIRVRKGKGVLKPDCKAPGYIQKSVGVGEDFNAVTIVNILFWPGFIVDAVTGTIQKYPSHMSVVMEPLAQ